MGFIKDILPILNNTEITFEKSYKESGDIYTFIFYADKEIKWNAGQHGVFTIKHEKINKPTRPFSIASNATDGYIEISTRVGDKPSEYKQALMNLKPGMKINMRGPIGGFYLRNRKPTLLIAGGIGITPYKSIIKDIATNLNKAPETTHLLYMDSNNEFINQDEFDRVSNTKEFIVDYINKREDLLESIERFVSKHGNRASYFIVGSSTMTKSITAFLRNYEVSKKNIIRDIFIGY